ncbi:polysaccharide deacetylase [Frankia sp. CcI49]|nr:polysaccharide deacetylase [Frankia sp. CcI49]
MSLSRRALLTAPVLAFPTIAACGVQQRSADPPAPFPADRAPRSGPPRPPGADPSIITAESVGTAPPAGASAAGTPAETAHPTANSTASATPSRTEIISRYQGVQPTAWGLEVAGVITRLPTRDRVIALTFDACGGPHGSGYDRALIDCLRENGTAATLFLNSRWIDANPRVCRDLAAEPLFEIANHGTVHRPLSVSGRSAYGISGTHDAGEVFDEIAVNRDRIQALVGHPPRFFRAGTAHCDNVATAIVADLGEHVVNFDVNGDAGATFSAGQVTRAVLTARPGSIVIAHLNHPEGGTARGFAKALPQLAAAGYRFVRLSDQIGTAR